MTETHEEIVEKAQELGPIQLWILRRICRKDLRQALDRWARGGGVSLDNGEEFDEFEDDEDGRRCHWCSGEGWRECHDPLECTSPHNALDECRCGSCGGSGLAKDMTIW